MKLESLYQTPIETIHQAFVQPKDQGGTIGSFSDVFSQTIAGMNAQEQKANNLMLDVVQGKSEQTHLAMIELEEASFQMGVAVKVRDGAIGMINHVMSGQI